MTETAVPVPDGSPYPLVNLPYGVFTRSGDAPRIGVAIGEHVLDLAVLARQGLLDGAWFTASSLNAFMAAGPETWRRTRERLTDLVTDPGSRERLQPALHRQDAVAMVMPFEVADFVDFYASLEHATNLGRILRPDSEPLLPNWRHLPVGYHGRSGTVVVSGTPVRRPVGQRRGDDGPTFGPSRRLDFEVEVGFVVGVPSTIGEPVPASAFAEHVFGVVLVNDWSARDIQSWEYQPLGPFLGKSFATSISPWVVPLAALEGARVAPPLQDPPVLDYLRTEEPWGLDLDLEVHLGGGVVSRPSFAGMYWTAAQMLAHLTVGGASLRTGDLYASGTVSGESPAQRGSLIELSWNGEEPLTLPDGSVRTFLEDGDVVTIAASAPGVDGGRIGLGSVTGAILPPRTLPRP